MIGIEEMLLAREQRAARQAGALARFHKPVLSVTIVMPGPVKDGPLARRILNEALRALDAQFSTRVWPVLSRDVLWRATGPEALYALDVAPAPLKAAMIELEDGHKLGRLWDLDVLAPRQGGLSRQALGFPARKCLVCDEPAHGCARSRRHDLAELLTKIHETVHEYDARSGT